MLQKQKGHSNPCVATGVAGLHSYKLAKYAPVVRVSTASFIAGKRAQTSHVMILVLFYIVWLSEF